MTRLFHASLEEHGLLACSPGQPPKQVRDMYALRSLPCAAALPESGDGAQEGAARVGRQPAHSDASAAVEPGATPLHALADADMPLSAMLAVQPGTRLWVYPSGCAKAEAAPAAAPLAAGARVMARHGGKAPWYAGAVSAVRADGSLDIAYDDGDQEEAVPPHLVRPAAAPAAAAGGVAAEGEAAAGEAAAGEAGEAPLLVELELGDMLVWRGDLVHAGAGYDVEHVRVHAYIDTPDHIYRRPRGRTNLCGAEE
jgi:hypothetical protein